MQFSNDVAFDFEDMFANDPASQRRISEIASEVRPRVGGRLFAFTPKADTEQQRFIDSGASTMRLLAPAGSGKTQSVANRVISRISKGDSADQFLILTFDNAAAQSMREKLKVAINSIPGLALGNIQTSTLNSFGNNLFRGILSDSCGALTLGSSPVRDCLETIRRTLDEFKAMRPDINALLPRELSWRVYLDLIGTLKNDLILPEDLFSKDANADRQRLLDLCQGSRLFEPWLEPLRGRPDEEAARHSVLNALGNIYRHYCRLMRNHNRIDFDDQKLLPYLAFAEDNRLAAAAMRQFHCVIVDEFQDINRLDFELIKLMAQEKQLIVVGDDDQAIYGFRGCTPDYILRFPERIGRDVETHTLRVNYRSPRNIVAMSNRLIQHNTDRIDKDQVADSTTDATVKVWHCLNSASEAQILARTIKQLHANLADSGFSYSDVAILFRMNSQSLPIQMALILEEIPYHCRNEENVIVSETMEKLLGLIGLHLRLRENPTHRSWEDTRLLCQCYFRYARDQEIKHLHGLAEQTGRYDEAARAAACAAGSSGKFTRNFVTAVSVLYTSASPAGMVQAIASNFKKLGGLVGSLDDAIGGALPLGELVDIASRFKGDIREFHSMVTALLARVQGGLFHEKEGDAVNLLTYFKAKGRQFHSVIVPGVNQKVIPHGRAKIEDERRLFYVAVTRATHSLTLSYVRQAVRCPVDPSQFLAEMGAGSAEEKRAAAIT